MIGRAGFSSKCWRVLRWAGLAAAAPALWACTSRTLEKPNINPTANLTTTFSQKVNNNIDVLFMIDNSSSMDSMEKKLVDQLPTFMDILEKPMLKPNLHVAVVSSDMGAPSDENLSGTGSNCNLSAGGDQGQFQSSPRTDTAVMFSCSDSTIMTPPGAANSFNTFISDVDGVQNFTNPIAQVFQCISLLGANGCGFEHQLASIDRALGSDNFQRDSNGNLLRDKNGYSIPQPPAGNQGFLRDGAYLGIVILTNEDDCSAPANTTIYSTGAGNPRQSITNPDGPIANYRCNGGPRGAHLCQDPAMGNAMIVPPLNPPPDATTGGMPTLDLASCEDNPGDSNALIHVSQFVEDIKALKPDPDDQILVAAISAPPSPYTVVWLPGMPASGSGPELWPSVEHSCGGIGTSPQGVPVNPNGKPANDGSFGDPGVRIAEFVGSFRNSVLASICDPTYSESMTAIANKINALITPPCIKGNIQTDAANNNAPICAVVNTLTDMQGKKTDVPVPYDANCNVAGANPTLPCWSLVAPGAMSTCTGQTLQVRDTQANMASASEQVGIDCSICLPGAALSGCPCIAGNMVPGCT
jgi:hypothetical protein